MQFDWERLGFGGVPFGGYFEILFSIPSEVSRLRVAASAKQGNTLKTFLFTCLWHGLPSITEPDVGQVAYFLVIKSKDKIFSKKGTKEIDKTFSQTSFFLNKSNKILTELNTTNTLSCSTKLQLLQYFIYIYYIIDRYCLIFYY